MRRRLATICALILASTLAGCCVPAPMCLQPPPGYGSLPPYGYPYPNPYLAPPPMAQPVCGPVAAPYRLGPLRRQARRQRRFERVLNRLYGRDAEPESSCCSCSECCSPCETCTSCCDNVSGQPQMYQQPACEMPACEMPASECGETAYGTTYDATYDANPPMPAPAPPVEPQAWSVQPVPDYNIPLPPSAAHGGIQQMGHKQPQPQPQPPAPRAAQPAPERTKVPGQRVQLRQLRGPADKE
ncbi:MAG: hypothetical protein R3C19_15890 [Planctomycetaceae bacterium]